MKKADQYGQPLKFFKIVEVNPQKLSDMRVDMVLVFLDKKFIKVMSIGGNDPQEKLFSSRGPFL